MPDLLGLLQQLARTAQAAPTAARLLVTAERAARGDQAALAYLRDAGLYDAAELLQPGAGAAARDAVRHGGEAIASVQQIVAGQGYRGAEVVEGEYRELPAEESAPAPWLPFQRWLAGRRWGAWVILGPKGQGKTTLALRLAEVWHRRHGYPVEGVNLYHEDRPAFLDPIPLGELQRRMTTLGDYLGVGPDWLEELVEDAVSRLEGTGHQSDRDKLGRAFRAMRRRVVVLDEASLAMGTTSADAGRRVARQVMAQARHLCWHVVYVGQIARQLPTDLLTAEAVFVKKPGGWESEVDRQEPVVQRLWTAADERFRWLHSRAHDEDAERRAAWRDAYPDARSWAYVDCRARLYRGLMPFSPAGTGDPDGGEDDDAE